jgi:hypothetical protein
MIKVSVRNKQGITGWAGQFQTQEEADAWTAFHVANTSWGLPDRWVSEEEVGDNMADVIETRVVEVFPAIPEIVDPNTNQILNPGIPAVTKTEYRLDADYRFEQTDITAEVAAEALANSGLARQELGARVIAKVYAMNEAKNISAETFAALMSDANIERIERMLWTGSLKTAKMMIQALDNTFLTEGEKQTLLDMLADY